MIGTALLLGWAVFVAAWLIPLGLDRSFHVDEVQVAYNAALLGLHELSDWMNLRAPFVVVLSWVARGGGEGWPILLEMRALFLALFLVNLALVACAAPHFRGFPQRAALLLAVTFVQPFWRHGFEVRHDTLLLTCSLALFALTQRAARRGIGVGGWAVAGGIAATAQLNSFKAFLVWPPALVLLLVVARKRGPVALPRAALATAAGGAVGLGLGALALVPAGEWRDYWVQFRAFGELAGDAVSFGLGGRLWGLLGELPHLLALALVAALRLLLSMRQSSSEADLASLACTGWLLLELLALLLNPTPYTYNLVHVIPFLFLSAVDGLAWVLSRAGPQRGVVTVAFAGATALAFAFSWQNDRVVRVSGEVQRRHVEAAEALTAKNDPVLDAAGLVLSRRPPGREWMLHSLFRTGFHEGRREPFHVALRRDPAPVLLTNYRWNWLERADRELVSARYVALGPHFLVLGGELRVTVGEVVIHRAGRYLVVGSSADDAPQLGGTAVPPSGIVTLTVGQHSLVGGPVRWFWIGPRLEAPPYPGPPLASRDLFVSD